MNPVWKNFLLAESAPINGHMTADFSGHESSLLICPLPHLGILRVSGQDAANFLQGQITCDIRSVNSAQGTLGAFCNAKGRVISTFVLVTDGQTCFLLLPIELLETVKSRLQKYILRADVTLTDCSDDYCLLGLTADNQSSTLPAFSVQQQTPVEIVWPGNRKLIIAEIQPAMDLWTNLVHHKQYLPGSPLDWQYQDIVNGLPWLNASNSEEYIPQMLNLDKLGAISFNKGCYTGQEIVARTHFLGQARREMFLAEFPGDAAPETNTGILGPQPDSPPVGKVLSACCQQGVVKLLIVMQTPENDNPELVLNTSSRDRIFLLPL